MQLYEYSGKVEFVGPTQTVGQKGFQKREFVVQQEGTKYPSPIAFTLKKDKCALADTLKQGMDVTVKFTLDGRRWDGPNGTRFFNDLVAFDVKSSAQAGSGRPVPPPAEAPDYAAAPSADNTDLPF